MATSDYFASTYAEARDKFIAAARRAGAGLAAYPLPDLRGPSDEELAIDVAMVGPEAPESVLVLVSGTHGVEGFGGSGCQVGFLSDALHEALPPGTGTLLVHALNPHGFAWLRRVNEDNVDLNRNFRDFSAALPHSAAYESLHDALIPEDWDGPRRREADERLLSYMAEHGAAAFQAAVSGGQYTRPTGLFYGGTAASWSNTTFRRILREHLAGTARKLVVFDYHSGLGPAGYGEPIHVGAEDDLQRARHWFGPEVTSTNKGTSSSPAVSGCLRDAFRGRAPERPFTYLALEYGTRPIMEVLTALRADHWLHAVPERNTPLRDGIKREIRDAFYVDRPAWKTAVYGRAADFVTRAGRALANM